MEGVLCQILSGRTGALDWDALDVQDWNKLQALANQESVAPLLYWLIKEHLAKRSTPPALGLDGPRASYYSTLANNALLFSLLWEILAALKQQDIPVLLLKGASLAHTCYPDLGLRSMGDLDLLFHQEDVPRAAQVLRQVGLTPVVMEDEDNPANLNIYAQPFVGETAAMHVELHWNLFGKPAHRYEPDLGWVWANSQPYALPDGTDIEIGDVRVLTPSLNFLYLTAHLVLKHRGSGERLLWYVDLYQLQARYDLDWNWIAEAAERCNWGAGLYACLQKLARDFCVELPPGYLERIRQGVSEQDWQYLHMRDKMQAQDSGELQHIQAALTPLQPLDRLKFILGATFPNPDYMRWRYRPSPKWLWPLTYPYRWLRAVRKFLNLPDIK